MWWIVTDTRCMQASVLKWFTHYIRYTVYDILYNIHYILHTTYYILYTIHYTIFAKTDCRNATLQRMSALAPPRGPHLHIGIRDIQEY